MAGGKSYFSPLHVFTPSADGISKFRAQLLSYQLWCLRVAFCTTDPHRGVRLRRSHKATTKYYRLLWPSSALQLQSLIFKMSTTPTKRYPLTVQITRSGLSALAPTCILHTADVSASSKTTFIGHSEHSLIHKISFYSSTWCPPLLSPCSPPLPFL